FCQNVNKVWHVVACPAVDEHSVGSCFDYSLEQVLVCSEDNSVLFNSYFQDFIVWCVRDVQSIKTKNAELARHAPKHCVCDKARSFPIRRQEMTHPCTPRR